MALRYYQKDLSDLIDDEWATGHDNVLAVAPTGSGKTVLFAHKLANCDRPSVSIAHRQELVVQMSLALAREKLQHRVIAPPNLIRWITQVHTMELGRDYYRSGAPVAVAGVDTLIRRTGELRRWAQSVGLWVIDECFPPGTLVDGVPISKLKVGDMVNSFDEHSGGIHLRRVTRVFKNKCPETLIRVVTQSHHVLVCTSGHPFWTKRGWVPASELTLSDEVLCDGMYLVSERYTGNVGAPKVSLPENWKHLLREKMRVLLPRQRAEEKGVRTKKNTLPDALLHLWRTCESVRRFYGWIPKNKKGLLQQKVLASTPGAGVLRNNGENESEVCFREDAEKQSDAPRGAAEKDAGNPTAHGASTHKTRGEWSASYGVGVSIRQHVQRLRFWAANYCANRATFSNAAPLQNRLRKSFIEDSSRGGRVKSLQPIETGAGRKERCVSYWSGVGSVSVLKRSDIEQRTDGFFDGYVYNIEVEEFNTYIAGGVVVHNCHHLLADNKWGTAAAMFPNALGLGVTATPERADGKGLGRHADGLFDAMVIGPSMRQLIDEGYLTDYRIICPPSNIDLKGVSTGKEGDWVRGKLGLATRKSSVMGDVVEHYCKWAMGKRGVTFTPDVETAMEMAAGFNTAGVPAQMICAKTPDRERREAIGKLASGDLLQLVNVDLFGEGFDLPAIEVISMARATQSYGLYVQQFGRALRLLEGKEKAVILDHVGNVARHNGPPDVPRDWTLDRRERRSGVAKDPNIIPITTCTNPECMAPYEAVLINCPFCGWIPTPSQRSAPEFVDGDLCELDAETLARMRGEVAKVDLDPLTVQQMMERSGHSYVVAKGAANRHAERQTQQGWLRESMALWMGYQKVKGRGVREAQRRFYHRFGRDVMTAQALGRADAEALTGLVCIDVMRLANGGL